MSKPMKRTVETFSGHCVHYRRADRKRDSGMVAADVRYEGRLLFTVPPCATKDATQRLAKQMIKDRQQCSEMANKFLKMKLV